MRTKTALRGPKLKKRSEMKEWLRLFRLPCCLVFFSFCLCFNFHCFSARKLTFPFIVASLCAIFKHSKSGRIFFKVQPSILLKAFLFPGVQNKEVERRVNRQFHCVKDWKPNDWKCNNAEDVWMNSYTEILTKFMSSFERREVALFWGGEGGGGADIWNSPSVGAGRMEVGYNS